MISVQANRLLGEGSTSEYVVDVSLTVSVLHAASVTFHGSSVILEEVKSDHT